MRVYISTVIHSGNLALPRVCLERFMLHAQVEAAGTQLGLDEAGGSNKHCWC